VPDPVATQIDALVAKGRAEFSDFDDRSAYVAAVAGNLDELRQAIGGMPDGHRIVAGLADDPDEAARILALRGHKLGAAIGQFAARGAKPAAAAAPPPPKAAAPDPTTDDALPMRDWSAAMNSRDRQRREAAKAPPTNRNLYDPNISDEDFGKGVDAMMAARQARRRGR
jgi:hypothetical protein